MYSINDDVLDREDPTFQDQLAYAYQSKESPYCLCQSDPVPMYIAKAGDNYLLKRLPNSGKGHAPDCDHYEIPSELSGRAVLTNSAISEDSATGITNLKLGFSLSKRSATNSSSSTTSTADTHNHVVKSPQSKLSLRAFLDCLFEDAALNKWSPKMDGKRNWFIIRKYLTEAILDKTVRNNPINIFIPEPFRLENKDALATVSRRFFNSLKKDNGKMPIGIVIAEFKSLEKSSYNFKLLLKHLPESPIYVSEAAHKQICKKFDRELALIDEGQNAICICTVYLSASGNPQLDSISMMAVHKETWLPFEDIDELQVIERLVREKRHFIKTLRYNLKPQNVIASALLTDTENPTAVFLSPIGTTEDHRNEIQAVIERSGLDHYIWDFDSTEPIHLPPKHYSKPSSVEEVA